MSNSTRNSLVLAGLLILILAIFLVMYGNTARKITELQSYNKKATVSIDSLRKELSVLDSLRLEYELKQALMSQQSKLILGEDSTTITYGYLLSLLNWSGRIINYDFAANDPKDVNAKYHEYIISGSSIYANLLHLTQQIEQQRAVITIEDLSIGSQSIALGDTVSFSMVLHTHYQEGGPQAEDLSLKKLNPPYTSYSLFKPRLSDEILPYDVDPALLNVEEAKLIGIARGMAFFRDGKGIIRILARGAPVAYGYLYRIEEATGKVIFRLDKYGLEEDYTISIAKSQ